MHVLKKAYREGHQSYVVECTCGWKEKAIDERSANGRFKHHQEYPQKG